MSVILRLGAVNTETPYSRLVSDGSEYDAPVDMSPVADEMYHSPPQTYPGCFGLPYQDHNYGAPPPPTPPQTPPPPPVVKESLDVKEEVVVTSDIPLATLTPPDPPLPDPLAEDADDPTRCICDYVHDDGYMIQCDTCSVWQHIVCMGLDRDSIPDTYLCEICHPRPVDRARAREFQIRKREFLKNLLVTTHDSSTDTDPEEVNNRLKAYGLDPSNQNAKPKQKVKMKKRKDRSSSKSSNKKFKIKEPSKEKENTNKDLNKKNKLLVKDFSSKTAQVKKEKLTKKIEKMRAERISKELLRSGGEDKFSSDDLREDEKIISTTSVSVSVAPAAMPVFVQDENAQNPWHLINNTFNEWEQSYEVAKYNQYTTYVQEYLNSTYINGHHNDIADLVTDGLRVQRCHLKELQHKMKGLQASCAIPDGQPIIEVIGKVMTRQQYDKDNFGQRQLSPFVFFYGKVFDLDLIIDASDYGNDARFIRRSCQPNAVVRHVVAGGQAHFITVATREILEGTEITIPFDYDYKKWNFCVECACLRNNCPVSRYQKRRMRFQKLQIDQTHKKFDKNETTSLSPRAEVKSPVRSPIKSIIKPLVKSPEKMSPEDHEASQSQPALDESCEESMEPTTPSPTKMVRRSQVSRQTSNNASTQASSGRLRSLRVPSQPDTSETEADPVTKPELSNLRSSEVDPLTSPESAKESRDQCSDSQDTPREKKKMTREERKMEAIMKAFEKMEKRNARKQSVDYTRPREKDEKKPFKKEPEKEVVVKQEEEPAVKVEVKVEPKIVSPVKPEPPPSEPAVQAENEEVKVEVKVEETKVEVKEVESVLSLLKPETRQRPPPKGKKAKKASSRRRTRNSSGAATISHEASMESLEDNSNSSSMPPAMNSCPVTPLPSYDDAASNSASTPFKFLKTKRHLMNEWLIEKSCDSKPPSAATRPEPLEVSVVEEEESMYVTCLPSPRNSMDRLRRNSQSGGSRDKHSQSVESTGSAKKRWLRQAMGEGSSMDNGLASPGHSAGGMSPNPQAPMPSPGGSPPADFVTPLKKRRLARESLSRDSISSESPTPNPTPSSATMVSATSYFSKFHEGYGDKPEKVESFRNKNGLHSFFSPVVTPSTSRDEEMLESVVKKTREESIGSEAQLDTTEKQKFVSSNSSEKQECVASNRTETQAVVAINSTELKECVASNKTEKQDCVASYFTEEKCVVNNRIEQQECVASTSYSTRKQECEASNSTQKQECAASNSPEKLESVASNRTERKEHVACYSTEYQECAASNSTDNQPDRMRAENPVSRVEEQICQPLEEEEKDGVSSCAEMDCSVSYNTSTIVCPDRVPKLISNTEIRSSSEVDGDRRVCSEQMSVCDGEKSANSNSEPDSSDSAGVCSETPMEVECDSGSVETDEVSVDTQGEVDSTESSQPPPAIDTTETEEQCDLVQASTEEVSSQNDQCDSCNSERLEATEASDSTTSSTSPSVAADKLCSSSSSTSTSSVTLEVVNSSVDVRQSKTSPSVVDSSTDKRRTQENDQQSDYVTESTVSVAEGSVTSALEPIPSVSSQEPVCGSSRNSVSFNDHESSGLINSTIESVPLICLDSLGATSSTNADSLIAAAYSTVDTANVPNRHLRFLTDCHINTEMVVDSTTHYMPSVLAGSITNNSVLMGTGAYDSDSMDVTSGTDLGLNGGLDETRNKSDDSMSGYPDNSTGRFSGEASIPKEKKKVSLQEYLKRKKDKPSTSAASATAVSSSTSSCSTSVGAAPARSPAVSSSMAKSPLRLTTNINLDVKLPPLPSLPSLPMFEKTERREFKSSSDLLSPIFNRKEKTEEVRKPMSLSERLRQEFGLDDSTDTDTEPERPDQRNGENIEDGEVPPPPPPPPPQQSLGCRSTQLKMNPMNQVANGNTSAIPSLMSLKTFPTPMTKASGDSATASAPLTPTSHAQLIPPVFPGVGGVSSSMGLSPNKSMPPSLMNLLSNVKSPAQLQNDLTTQLNALKAQINKVQQSLPISSSTNVGNAAASVEHVPPPINGTNSAAKPQVFDYGHQPSANFMRQNSYPCSTSSIHHYHGYNKSPGNYGKTSPGYNKLSPGFSKHSPSAGASHNNNPTGNHSYNNSHHNNMSPPAWNQKASSSHKHLSSSAPSNQRKHFSKQTSHKYS